MRAPIPAINVRNLQRKIRVDVTHLEGFARRALKLCLQVKAKQETELQRLPEVLVLIVSDRKIAALHRRFMNASGATDVITFQHGEIFLSVEMARRNARRFGNSIGRELRLYVVHGLLHLAGFDDQTPVGAREMEAVQGTILAKAEL